MVHKRVIFVLRLHNEAFLSPHLLGSVTPLALLLLGDVCSGLAKLVRAMTHR